MTAPFRTTGDYELFLYTLIAVDWYRYEVWQADDKLYWYDSQPHPNEPELQSTHPHHKHVPPDIKHHRISAPKMSFTRPNLPALIQEIEALIAGL
jgi:hypothetical protein